MLNFSGFCLLCYHIIIKLIDLIWVCLDWRFFFEWWYSVKVRYDLYMRLFFLYVICFFKVICDWTNIWKLNIPPSFETLQEWSARSFNWSLILITLFLMLDFGSDYPSRVTDVFIIIFNIVSICIWDMYYLLNGPRYK